MTKNLAAPLLLISFIATNLVSQDIAIVETELDIQAEWVDSTIVLRGREEAILPMVKYWSPVQPNAQLIDFLAASNTQDQLEFSAKQKTEFKRLKKEYTQSVSELYKKFPELKEKTLSREKHNQINQSVRMKSEKLKKEFSEKIKEVLVPHQLSTIQKMRFKRAVQSRGFQWALTHPPFADTFDVSKEQTKTLAEIEKKMQEEIQKAHQELQKKIAKIKSGSREKMLDVLSAKQRRTIRELEGDLDNK